MTYASEAGDFNVAIAGDCMLTRRLSVFDEPAFLARYRSGELVTALGLSTEDADLFWRRLMEFFLARGDLASLLPGASAALAELAARGQRIALVTGRASSESALRAEMRRHGLESYFDSVHTLGDLSRMRLNAGGTVTKTELFARACNDMDVEPAESALVTDWPAELDEGLEFGCAACIGVLTGGYRREDFPADPRVSVVADLTEFAAVLASIEEVAA